MNELNFHSVREQIIKKFIASELLDEGVFPSLEYICAVYVSEFGGNLSDSSLLASTDSINEDETASVKKFNKIAKLTEIDIHTLIKFVQYLDMYTNNQFTECEARVNKLLSEIKDLSSRVKAISFAKEYDSGHNSIKSIDFLNDLLTEESTAIVNAESNTITVSPVTSLSYVQKDNASEANYLTTKVSAPIVRTSVLKPRTGEFEIERNSFADKLIDGNEDTEWVLNISTPNHFTSEVIVGVSFTFEKPLSMSEFSYSLGSNTDSSMYQASLYTLKDGAEVMLVDYKQMSNITNFLFEEQLISHLILKIKTNIKISGKYKFVGREVKFSATSYSNSSTVITKEIEKDPFNFIGLYANEEIPESCSIEYFVKLYINGAWSEFTPIVPINREPKNYSGRIIKSTVPQATTYSALTSDFLGSSQVVHPFNYQKNMALTPVLTDNPDDIYDLENTFLLRNLNKFVVNSDSPNIMSGYFWLTEAREIDFRNYPVYIAGKFIDSIKELPAGKHKISFQNIDLAQEYYSYFDSIKSTTLYYCSYIAKYVPSPIFLNVAEDNNYLIYTYGEYEDSGTKYAFFVKDLREIREDHLYEDIILAAQPELLSTEKASKLQLKAVLNGFNHSTPVIKQLILKMG